MVAVHAGRLGHTTASGAAGTTERGGRARAEQARGNYGHEPTRRYCARHGKVKAVAQHGAAGTMHTGPRKSSGSGTPGPHGGVGMVRRVGTAADR